MTKSISIFELAAAGVAEHLAKKAEDDSGLGHDGIHSHQELLAHIEFLNELNGGGANYEEFANFEALYDARMAEFAKFCNSRVGVAWKSRLHADGSMFEGDWFVCGVNTPVGQYTYHYRGMHWDQFQVPELDLAPEWDGHGASDLGRLISIK